MLVANDRTPVTVDGEVEETKNFCIAATPHAYKILSDGLYSNKIKAVIRELSTNAYDAHVFSGKPNLPFDVVLPNSFNPIFSIRDYGPGMSSNDIMNLYTTYFKSGSYKIKSNDYVGCLGLGSKSPFAYTRSFSVTSFYQGKKTDYALYIGGDGIPTITNMGETDCEEDETGLMIIIPVNSADHYKFINEAKNVYRYFKVQPNVTGSTSYTTQKVEYVHEGEAWKIRVRDGNGICAVMGNICYPIEIDNIPGLSSKQKEVLGNNDIDLLVDIGKVSITPSREHLQYDNLTIDFLKEKYNQIVNEVQTQVETELQACKSLWQARLKTHELINKKFGHFNKIINFGNLSWNNINLVNNYCYPPSDISVTKFFKNDGIRYRNRRRRYCNNNYEIKVCKENTQTISFHYKAILVENDIELGGITRCMELAQQDKIVYMFNKVNEQLLEALGCEANEIIKVSSIPKPERKPRSTSHVYGSKSKVFEYRPNGGSADYSHWKEVEIELQNGGIYVILDRYLPVNVEGKRFDNWDLFDEYRKTLNKLGFTLPIYGIRATITPKIIKNPKWISLWEYISAKIKENEQRNLLQHFVNTVELNNFDLMKQVTQLQKRGNITTSDLFTELFKVMDDFKQSQNIVNNLDISFWNWKMLLNSVNYQYKIPEESNILSKIWDKITNAYPILQYIFKQYENISSECAKHVSDYVNQGI